MYSISTRVRVAPIVATVVYLNGTVLLLALGPWPWPLSNPLRFYGYLVLAHTSLLIGYLTAAFRMPRTYDGRWSRKRVFWCCAIITLILLPATSKARTGSWYPDIIAGLMHPGKEYSHALTVRASAHWAEYVRVLLGIPLTLLLPLTVYDWHRLSTAMRVTAVAGVAGYLAIFVAIGTNKALADAAILICALGAAFLVTGRVTLTRRRIVQLGGVAVAVVVSVFVFFSSGQFSRSGGLANALAINTTAVNWNSPARPPEERYAPLRARGAAYQPDVEHLVIADPRAALLRPFPDKVRRALVAFAGYLTQGYYGMSLAMDQPWVPTYGAGSSYFLVRGASRVLRWPGLEDRPYPMRVETHTGWDAYGKWTAFYAWIASDLTFPGTLLLLALIGRVLALAWLDTVEGSNPFAVGVFAVLVLMIAYFPANNQILANGESAVGFVGLVIVWLVTRKRGTPSLYLPMGRRLGAQAADGIIPATGPRTRFRALRSGGTALVAAAGERPTKRTCLLVLASVAIAAAGIAVWFRPRPAGPDLAQALIVPGAPRGASPVDRQRNATLLAALARSSGVIRDARSDVASDGSAPEIPPELVIAVNRRGLVQIQVGATSPATARRLADALARRVAQVGRLARPDGSFGRLSVVAFKQGAYSAPPTHLGVGHGDRRFKKPLDVTCSRTVGCGAGTDFRFPFVAGRPYRTTAWVRSANGRPTYLIVAFGHDPEHVSTTAPQRVTGDWRRLSVNWTPRADGGSAAVAIQTAKPSTTMFQIGAAAVSAVGQSRDKQFLGALDPRAAQRVLESARHARVIPARPLGRGSSPAFPWGAFGFLVGLLVAGTGIRSRVTRTEPGSG
jgi:hypothetical protein